MTDRERAPAPQGPGRWELVGLSGVIGTHAALLHSGSVLFMTRPEDPSHRLTGLDSGLPGDLAQRCTIFGEAYDDCVPDDALGAVVDVGGPPPFTPRKTVLRQNPFCAGHCFLPDGRLLVAGGDKKDSRYYGVPEGVARGLRSVRTFDPVTERWEVLPSMETGRWYPTCVTLPDGGVLILSGSLEDQQGYNNVNPTCELVPPLACGPIFLPFLVEAWPQHSLPPTYVLPNGRIYVFACNRAYYLEIRRERDRLVHFSVEPGPQLSRQSGKLYPNSSTSVLLPLRPADGYRAETMVIGGGGQDVYPHWGRFDDPASDRCFRLALDGQDASWRQTAPMPSARIMADCVLLPDGTVLVLNGTRAGYAGGNAADGAALAANAVLAPDLYDPAANSWTTMTPATCPRLYHSTALLLPDATVLVAGSDQQRLNRDLPENASSAEQRLYRAGGYEYRIERFDPPYLSAGPRPSIGAAPGIVAYGAAFSVTASALGDAGARLQAVLVAPGAVTHGNNMTQRLVELVVRERREDGLILEAPPNGWIAPPGFYMLFVLRDGVPSVAKFVRLEGTATSALARPVPPPAAAWFRSDLGVTLDAEGGVAGWTDLSGNGNDLAAYPADNDVEATPPIQLYPDQINGHAVLHFPLVIGAVSDSRVFGRFLRSDREDFATGSGPYSLFVVARPWPPGDRLDMSDRSTDSSDLIGWGDWEAGDGNAYVALRLGAGPRRDEFPIHRGTASIHSYWQDRWRHLNQDVIAFEQLFALDGPVLIECHYDGTDIVVRINRRELKRDSDRRDTRPGPLWVGRNGPNGAYYRGDMAEILVFDRAVDADERNAMHAYFNARYALWSD